MIMRSSNSINNSARGRKMLNATGVGYKPLLPNIIKTKTSRKYKE